MGISQPCGTAGRIRHEISHSLDAPNPGPHRSVGLNAQHTRNAKAIYDALKMEYLSQLNVTQAIINALNIAVPIGYHSFPFFAQKSHALKWPVGLEKARANTPFDQTPHGCDFGTAAEKKTQVNGHRGVSPLTRRVKYKCKTLPYSGYYKMLLMQHKSGHYFCFTYLSWDAEQWQHRQMMVLMCPDDRSSSLKARQLLSPLHTVPTHLFFYCLMFLHHLRHCFLHNSRLQPGRRPDVCQSYLRRSVTANLDNDWVSTLAAP